MNVKTFIVLSGGEAVCPARIEVARALRTQQTQTALCPMTTRLPATFTDLMVNSPDPCPSDLTIFYTSTSNTPTILILNASDLPLLAAHAALAPSLPSLHHRPP